MVEVVLRAVRVDVGSSTPILLLEEVHGERVLPIFIGQPEAAAIGYALQNVATPRPMTHDLMGEIIGVLGGRVFAVEIQSLVGSTYYGAVRLVSPSGEVTVSARPSDAIALALRVGAPILVNDELMAAEGHVLETSDLDEDELVEGDESLDEEDLVAELRAFLDDFGGDESP
jgi:bifunctional DNase/RNase